MRLHDSRHTVSLLLQLGTPPHIVQAIAHMPTSTSSFDPAHTNLDAMCEAVDSIEWEVR